MSGACKPLLLSSRLQKPTPGHYSEAAMQVPLLLGLGEEVKGLDKGLDAGDADLIYLAIFQLWRSRPLPSFLQLLNARPLARALFFSYAARKVIPRILI